jgi:hypothetical protein
MLGEQLVEETGKITGYRVRPSDGVHPRVEVSFQASGSLLGINATDMGTYQSILGGDMVLRGEGQGVIMTGEGDVITWSGQGVGKFTGQGTGSSWRGAIYYRTSSQKLARLNGVAAVFEHEVDGEGSVHNLVWEWK